MAVSLREEFQLRNLGLVYDQYSKFTVSQWHGLPDGVFIGWRVFWAFWHIGWLIRSIQVQIVYDADYDAGESAKWLIYLTNWSYLMLTIQSVLHLVIVVQRRWSHNGRPTIVIGVTNPWYHRALWLFTNISFTAAIFVTVFYWSLVFEELKRALSIMTHAVTTLYVVTDMFVIASPVRILHVIYPVIYGIIYLLFSVIYHLADGTNNEMKPYIYSALDWSDPGPTIGMAIGVAVVAVPLAHLFVFGLYALRCYIHQNCCGRAIPDDEETAILPRRSEVE